MISLLLRFREFVYARLSNHTNNAKNRNKGGAHALLASDSQADSIHTSGPDLEGILGSGTPNHESDFEVSEDRIFEDSDSTSADLLVNSIATSSPTSRSTSTNLPPEAPIVVTGSSMDHAEAKLNEPAVEPKLPELAQIVGQHQNQSKDRPDQSGIDSSSNGGISSNAGTAGSSVILPSGHAMQPLDYPDDQQQLSVKRKVNIDTSGTMNKRAKCTPNAYNLKPSRIVKLPVPQIKNKGSSTTRPAPRSHASFSETDEVIAGPSTLPVSTLSDSIATSEPELRQASLHSQGSSDRVGAANSDTVNVAVVSPPPSPARATSALPQDKGKGKALASPGPLVNLSDADLKTIAQFRSEWNVYENQISDDLLLAALEITSAEHLVAQISGEQRPPMPDPPSASAAQGRILATANPATKEAVVIDLTASSDEEDDTAQTGSDPLFDKRSAKNRDAIVMSGSGQRQDLTMTKVTNSAADSNSQHAITEASRATALADRISQAHLNTILRRVVMLLCVKREDGTSLPTTYITPEGMHTSEDFFRATQDEFQEYLEPDEQFTRALVVRTDGPLESGFALDRRSRRNIGWGVWLGHIRKIFDSDPRGFQMSMAADIFVTKKTGDKV